MGIFINLSKAVETLDHIILFQKLNHYGLADSSFTLLQNYLTNRVLLIENIAIEILESFNFSTYNSKQTFNVD